MSDKEKVIKEEIEDVVEEVKSDDAAQTEDNTPETAEKSELEAANEKIAGLSDKLMRTAAEFDNYKKRTAREKEDFYKMAVCETIAPLLPVVDNLERAVSAAENSGDDGSVLEGIKMIKKQFDDVLSSIGVEPIAAIGNEFDPERHNAVMTEESDEAENTVIEEFQKGYIYKDKVIRHSMVKVSN